MSPPKLYTEEEARERHRIASAKRRAENKEHVMAIEAAYRAKNRDKAAKWRENNREYQKKYDKERTESGIRKIMYDPAKAARVYEIKKETILASSKKWKKANPSRVKKHAHDRRARILGNGGTLSADIIERLMIEQKGICVYCPADLSLGKHLDHRIALALGGKNEDENVQLLCPRCNWRKGSLSLEEWERRR